MMEFNKHYCKYYGIKLVVCHCVQIGHSNTKKVIVTKDTMMLGLLSVTLIYRL